MAARGWLLQVPRLVLRPLKARVSQTSSRAVLLLSAGWIATHMVGARCLLPVSVMVVQVSVKRTPNQPSQPFPQRDVQQRSLQNSVDQRPEVQSLFENLQASLVSLEKLLSDCSSAEYEDAVYRFYHQSFKLYPLQEATLAIVAALARLAPDRKLNDWFMTIVDEGTSVAFDLEHNRCWLLVTRPIVEAFFHARYFLEMAVRYGKTLSAPPNTLPSGWAALLHLYDLR